VAEITAIFSEREASDQFSAKGPAPTRPRVPRQYDRDVVSFLESVGVTLVAAILTSCWHVLSSDEKPEGQELAFGFDLVVATMVLQTGFLPGSRGMELNYRWAGLVSLFLIIIAMAVATRMFGYGESSQLYRRTGSGKGARYTPVKRLTSKAGWLTSIGGTVTLCGFWWLNANIGHVVTVWQGVVH
jgi:hypothetical protein